MVSHHKLTKLSKVVRILNHLRAHYYYYTASNTNYRKHKKNELRKVHEALDLYILKSNIAHSQESLVDIQIMKSKSNSKGGVLNLLQFDFE